MNTSNVAASVDPVPPGHVRSIVHGAYWLGLTCLVRIGFGHVHGADALPIWPAALFVVVLTGAIASTFAIMRTRLHPVPAEWFRLHLQWHMVTWSVVMYVTCAALAVHALGLLAEDALPSLGAVFLRSPSYIAAVAGVWFAYRMVCGYGSYLTKSSPERCMLGTRSDFEQLMQQRH